MVPRPRAPAEHRSPRRRALCRAAAPRASAEPGLEHDMTLIDEDAATFGEHGVAEEAAQNHDRLQNVTYDAIRLGDEASYTTGQIFLVDGGFAL